MPSRVVLPPEEFWRGTRPSHAANWRPLWKTFASPTLATNALAVSGPIPGIACSGWLAVSSRGQAFISGSPHFCFQKLRKDLSTIIECGSVFRNQNNTLLFEIFQGYLIPIREGCDEQLAGDVSRTQTVAARA